MWILLLPSPILVTFLGNNFLLSHIHLYYC
uniref:Uncharacterized protein n=1 Tax=Rhizophora mucronata TaxID=61149 RepID=A0A2P2QP77_RHIMU